MNGVEEDTPRISASDVFVLDPVHQTRDVAITRSLPGSRS